MLTLLQKYDGVTEREDKGHAHQYQITRLPKYLVLHVRRFTRNNWTAEKNRTIVNVPIIKLDLEPCKWLLLSLAWQMVGYRVHSTWPLTISVDN